MRTVINGCKWIQTRVESFSPHFRLSPEMMEERDGFLTMTRNKIEAAVKSNGLPGIMVAHSVR